MDNLIIVITAYRDVADSFAAHAVDRAQQATSDIERRLWEAEAAKESAVAMAYRTALNAISRALTEASEAQA